MQELLKNIKIQVNEKTFIKNPETSELGKRIVEQSITLIDEIGFDAFTFRKLGVIISSNESSIYRYFENKHKLLLYLTSWYWAWMEYQIVLQTYSIPNASEKLEKIISIITAKNKSDSNFSHINEKLLNKIVINEYSKSFLTKEVDAENKEGYFSIYKRLITRIKNVIIQINKNYPFPASLASTLVEGSLHQHFLADHFPTITDCGKQHPSQKFYTHLIFNTLKK
ncbi:TetR/AcrR family transcriptional regulator [Polaribacter ponticola]|uniref:TetR/AcrR family transcriptional regulator n=1 Tax=Polaribacter ponticola TaxID=2978475 RepID=A0ABT5S4M6_9FLAO|nr:TetR/AcrR family transcriptional regulator [Polaribacter sp. MSW5]MDD7913060.1 TetR/AcrR family transcriptional regulator [Polaribacter sp. MSW5]